MSDTPFFAADVEMISAAPPGSDVMPAVHAVQQRRLKCFSNRAAARPCDSRLVAQVLSLPGGRSLQRIRTQGSRGQGAGRHALHEHASQQPHKPV